MESKDVPRSRLRVITHLEQLAQSVKACTGCELSRTRTNTVFASGSPHADLCFIGEGPGESEDIEGVPFVGASGRKLDKMIASIGLKRDDVYVCNVVKCRPPGNRKPKDDEIAACAKNLLRQLVLVAPRVIVALGASAAQALDIMAPRAKFVDIRGKWQKWRDIDVMPTYHPAYLFHKPQMKTVVSADMQAVAERLGQPRRGLEWE